MDSERHFSKQFPFSDEILSLLLVDHTTGKNILWATNDYEPISAKSQIKIEQITGENADRIKPRIAKKAETQVNRTRMSAEVFTPSWICNEQNNVVDASWFKAPSPFNMAVPGEHAWTATREPIPFNLDITSGKTWQDYVKATRMEITCGEAPYLVSRYDSATGKAIKLEERIGLLDRKLRVVSENVRNEAEFFLWTEIAYQNCYGFELSGDNLLLARSNLLLTFVDYTKRFLKRKPTEDELLKIARIISWNIWQMDGLTGKTPFSSGGDDDDTGQPSLFEEMNETESFPCKIMDWKNNKIVQYKSCLL